MDIISEEELIQLEKENAQLYTKKSVVVKAWITTKELYIETLEGVMKANKGDYIIKGVLGEYYPCKPEVFKETYSVGGNNPKIHVKVDTDELLQKIEEKTEFKDKLLEEVEHELTCLHGLYAADNQEFKDSFKIDNSKLLEKIKEYKNFKITQKSNTIK